MPRELDVTQFRDIICVFPNPEGLDRSAATLVDRIVRAAPVSEPTEPVDPPRSLLPYFRHLSEAPGFVPRGTPAALDDEDDQEAIRHHVSVAHLDSIQAFRYEPLVTNGHGDGVGFSARAVFGRGFHTSETAPIVWLPPAPEPLQASAIDQWLRSNFSVAGEATPAWAGSVSVAAAVGPEGELDGARERLVQATDDVARLTGEVAEARRLAALLWETGEVLEGLVLEALEALGCEVTRPEGRGKEDGRAVDPNGVPWTVEVKGNKRGVKQDDVKDANAHATEAMDVGVWEGRPLLVVNTHRLDDPGTRRVVLPANAADLARLWGVPILLTSQLLDAVNELHDGTFDAGAFWAVVSEAAGLVDVTRPTKA